MKLKLWMLLIVTMFAFVACGGGGADPEDDDVTATAKIVRLDETELDFTATPIPLRISIKVTFSAEVDPETVESNASLADTDGNEVAGTFSWNDDNTIVTYTPSQSLDYNTTYEVTIGEVLTSLNLIKNIITLDDNTFTTMIEGDVNGDGYTDILVGAARVDNGGTRKGQAYLFFGSADISGDLTGNSTDADLTISGENDNDLLGSSVSLKGDVNGDGYADILVGARGVNADGSAKGQAYLYFGASDITGNKTGNTTDANLVITGASDNDALGDTNAASIGGDVNGDGYADILIGASNSGAAGTNRGQAYLFFGASDISGEKTANATDANVVISGGSNGDFLGMAASLGGDVNGDGYDDILVGSQAAATNMGQTWLFLGAADISGEKVGNTTDAALIITGASAANMLGVSLSLGGDVNGDGYDDILVGALNAGSTSNGQAFLFFGSADISGEKEGSTTDADLVISGANNNDILGVSVSLGGDVNGDGYDDIIAGAVGASIGGVDNGQAYLFLGSSDISGEKTGNTTDADLVITGVDDHSWLGDSSSLGGDVNGDGYDDILVGAALTDALWTDRRGGAFLFMGSSDISGEKTANTTDATLVITGENVDDRLGDSLSL